MEKPQKPLLRPPRPSPQLEPVAAACCLSQLSAGNMAVTWPEISAVSKYWTSREETDTNDSSEQQKLMLHISAPREPR